MAFQQKNPVFSYLNEIALIVLGVICVVMVAVAFYDLFALFVVSLSLLLAQSTSTDAETKESTYLLRLAHRVTWAIVILFLVDFFANIVLFGIQKRHYEDWCMDAYQGEEISPSVFNCDKLWEDELKLGIAVFIVLCICYLYWATCLWSYAQKIVTVSREAAKALARGPPLPMVRPPPPMAGTMPPGTMMPGMYNLKPNIMVLDDGHDSSSIPMHTAETEQEDGQKSAAQIARILFQKVKDAWR
ncbi:hypothetical protein BJV82DRAFT_667444 [Fennellomyces sp. T-0311]|nr:hypothetical protein BJV82DRAFT_667444 [Fennellomyces sp. T-0311]